MGPPECSGPPAAERTHATAAGRNGLGISAQRYANVRVEDSCRSQKPCQLTRHSSWEAEGLWFGDACDISDLISMLGDDNNDNDGADAAAIDEVVDMMERDEQEQQLPPRQPVSARIAAAAVYRELQIYEQPTPTAHCCRASVVPSPVPVPVLPSVPMAIPLMMSGCGHMYARQTTLEQTTEALRALITPPNIPSILEQTMTQQQIHDLQQMQRQRKVWDQQQIRLHAQPTAFPGCGQASSARSQSGLEELSVSTTTTECTIRVKNVISRSQKKPSTSTNKALKKDTVPDKKTTGSKRTRAIRWSPKETDCLAQGVAMFGVGSWLKIKNHFQNQLASRTNVDLKDRWRNVGGQRQSKARQQVQKRKQSQNHEVVYRAQVQVKYDLEISGTLHMNNGSDNRKRARAQMVGIITQ